MMTSYLVTCLLGAFLGQVALVSSGYRPGRPLSTFVGISLETENCPGQSCHCRETLFYTTHIKLDRASQMAAV